MQNSIGSKRALFSFFYLDEERSRQKTIRNWDEPQKKKVSGGQRASAHQWLTSNNLAGPVGPYRESLSQVANGAVRGNHASESFAILI
jgi:hypothetical protein